MSSNYCFSLNYTKPNKTFTFEFFTVSNGEIIDVEFISQWAYGQDVVSGRSFGDCTVHILMKYR